MTGLEYRTRMWKSRQFQFFGIYPQWKPGEKDIDGFVHDEVVRQMHDPRVPRDGGDRVRWMRNGWTFAQMRAEEGAKPTTSDIISLGHFIEPQTNALGLRLQPVWIGDRQGAPIGFLPQMIDHLTKVAPHVVPGKGHAGLLGNLTSRDFVEQIQELVSTVDDWYLAYEWVHPFLDGNGRTGKILHNWLNGTLDDPVLVPDYFGAGNP